MKKAHSVARAPIDERARVLTTAVAEAARQLELGPTELGRIIGVSQPTATRLLRGQYALAERSKEWELAANLVRLYRSLYAMVGGSDETARQWLKSANRATNGEKPLDAIKTISGLVHVCQYLDSHRARV